MFCSQIRITKERKKIKNVITSSIRRDTSAIQLHITGAGHEQYSIVGAVSSPIDAAEATRFLYERIARILSDRRVEIVHERIFGSLSVRSQVLLARNDICRRYAISTDTPITYIEGNPAWGDGLAGVIIHAVLPSTYQDVWTIMDGDVPCGRGWSVNGLTYLVFQDIQASGKKGLTPPILPLHKGRSEEGLPSYSLRQGSLSGSPPLRGGEKGEGELCDPTDDRLTISRPAQARLVIERAERILRENGASYKDVVRTWFYLSDILGWYAAFNKVRNEKYGEFGIMPGPGDRQLLLPASTGIQGETPSGAACAMDLLAVLRNDENGSENTNFNTLPSVPSPQGRGGNSPSPLEGVHARRIRSDGGRGEGEILTKIQPSIRRLTNPLQLDAFRYGSAFARGSVVKNGSTNLIEISGTAAIDEHGLTLYQGDIRAQIDCTLDKVQTLLEQEGAGFKDICSATVFVKQTGFAEIFYEMAAARGLENFPCVCIVADVCREELLFEIDAEAVVKKGGGEESYKMQYVGNVQRKEGI